MTIESNINDRKAAESLHQTIGELLASEVPRLPSDNSRMMFFRLLEESAKKNLPHQPRKTEAAVSLNRKNAAPSDEVEEALELNSEIQSLADEVEWPDAQAVAEKAADIIRVIEKRGYVTAGQFVALENMHDAMNAWTTYQDWD